MKSLSPHAPAALAPEDLQRFLTHGSIYASGTNSFFLAWDASRDPSGSPGLSNLRFFCPEFFAAAAPDNESVPKGQAIVDRLTLQEALQSYLTASPKIPVVSWEAATRDVFSQQFSALKGLIDRGEILKGVPYSQIRASATVSPSWIAARLHAALRKESATYLYGTWSEAEGIIGCTPERLCYYEQDTQVVTTEVVAGTKTLESYHYGALLNDPKAIREHTLVIEDLSERLSEFGAVEIGTTDECQVPGLVHLKTPLRVLVRRASISLRDVVQRLHPTAALGVYPRNSAGRAWLQEADRQLPRWRFGAPFGVSFSRDPENSRVNAGFSCLVAIRNVQWRGKLLCINAGCGVIESSQLEWEWQECLAKIQSIRNLLDL